MAESTRDLTSPARTDRPAAPRPRARRRRWLLGALVVVPLAGVGAWVAVHRIPWMGPLVANGLRAVIGSENVTRLEEAAYAAEDSVNRLFRTNEPPRAYWDVPEPASAPPATATPVAATGTATSVTPATSATSPTSAPTTARPAFRPADVGPMHTAWPAPGDGRWVPIVDRQMPEDAPRLWKTLIHPDPRRSWAELFVVAIDLSGVEVHLLAGSREPAATTEEGKTYTRAAKIPEAHHERLLAAWNGGFMTEHGQWGMRIDGVTLVPARDKGCTIALYRDGRLRVATWPKIAGDEGEMSWWRQAPKCMVEDGEVHPLLRASEVRDWGATLEGNTVIRRSAIGLDGEGKTLFVAISNHTTAQAIALGLRHAGAAHVAQLDVNWSYPKFLLFEPGEGGAGLKPVALASGFEFSEDEYIRKRSLRDFFYLTRKAQASGGGT